MNVERRSAGDGSPGAVLCLLAFVLVLAEFILLKTGAL